MAQQVINLGATANDGTGDTARAAGAKLNGNFAELWQLATSPYRAGNVDLIVTGDSKSVIVGGYDSGSALFWAASRNLFDINALVPLGLGGSTTNNAESDPKGLTGPTRLGQLQTAIAASLASGHYPVVIVKAGTNDTSAMDTVANMRKFINAAKLYGARAIILMTVDPRGATVSTDQSTSNARRYNNINHGFRQIAQQDPAVILCDSTAELVNQASATFANLGRGLTAGYNATMYDGYLHENNYGGYLQSDALGDALSLILRKKRPFTSNPADVYDATDNPRGNLLGSMGLFYDTGGTTSAVTLSGGGGVTNVANWPSAKLFANYPGLSGTLSGTMAVDIQQVPYAGVPLRNDANTTPIKAPRLVFSGTPTSDVTMNINTSSPTLTFPSSTDFRFEADLFCNALQGLAHLTLAATLSGNGARSIGGYSLPPGVLPTLNGRMLIASPSKYTVPSASGFHSLSLKLFFPAGTPVSGSIDIGSMALWIENALPAPTA